MTTVADAEPRMLPRDDGFFLNAAIAMALVIVAGFSFQLAAGRSSFASAPLVHAHAVVFMGWVAIFLTQNVLVAIGRTDLHRRLGWLAAGWILAMLVFGTAVTVAMVRDGRVPFFFRPLQFLIFDPMTLLCFTGLTVAAIQLRRQTDWHRRLHLCAMSLLLSPAFGRLLPMPLLQPWAWEASHLAGVIFPLIGAGWDLRRTNRVHPAWWYGLAVTALCLLLTDAITYSPVGTALYDTVTTGSPGAAVPPLSFPPPPPAP